MDSNIDDGGPAFPRITTGEAVRNFGSNGAGFDLKFKSSEGVSLRDFFAANASDSDLSAAYIAWLNNPARTGSEPPPIAELRYMHADAMLEARKR